MGRGKLVCIYVYSITLCGSGRYSRVLKKIGQWPWRILLNSEFLQCARRRDFTVQLADFFVTTGQCNARLFWSKTGYVQQFSQPCVYCRDNQESYPSHQQCRLQIPCDRFLRCSRDVGSYTKLPIPKALHSTAKKFKCNEPFSIFNLILNSAKGFFSNIQNNMSDIFGKVWLGPGNSERVR